MNKKLRYLKSTLAILVITMAVFVSTATVDAMKPDLEYLQYVSDSARQFHPVSMSS